MTENQEGMKARLTGLIGERVSIKTSGLFANEKFETWNGILVSVDDECVELELFETSVKYSKYVGRISEVSSVVTFKDGYEFRERKRTKGVG